MKIIFRTVPSLSTSPVKDVSNYFVCVPVRYVSEVDFGRYYNCSGISKWRNQDSIKED